MFVVVSKVVVVMLVVEVQVVTVTDVSVSTLVVCVGSELYTVDVMVSGVDVTSVVLSGSWW